MQPPPAYEGLFSGEDEIYNRKAEVPGEEEIILPNEVKEIGDGYEIGNEVFKVNHENKTIETEEKTIYSDKIYNILTNRNFNISWDELNDDEQMDLGNLIVNSNILYEDKKNKNIMKPIQYKQNISGQQRWERLYSNIWYNRFLFMDDERLNSDFERDHMKKSFQIPTIRKKMTDETKQLIKTYFPNLKGEGLKGSGLKKNYVTLPNDPSELVDRLTLLAGSKDAGNTGVYNEMVSICDELLKRKIIGKGQYKQFLNNI